MKFQNQIKFDKELCRYDGTTLKENLGGNTTTAISFAIASASAKINKKEFFVKKLSTENKELYGSVKPTEISKLIKEKEKLDITPSMIQPIKEIKSLGKFKVKVSLHSEIDAEIHIVVESAETIQ